LTVYFVHPDFPSPMPAVHAQAQAFGLLETAGDVFGFLDCF